MALVAVVERVETAHNVPVSIDLIIIDALNIVRGGTARRIVQRVGSWKPKALVISINALHHIVDHGRLVAFRALQGARSVVLGALAGATHIGSAGCVTDAGYDLSRAVTREASSILDWQAVISVLIDEALEVPREDFRAFFIFFGRVDDILNHLIDLFSVLVDIVGNIVEEITHVIEPALLCIDRCKDKA